MNEKQVCLRHLQHWNPVVVVAEAVVSLSPVPLAQKENGCPTNFEQKGNEVIVQDGKKVVGLRMNPPSPGKGRSSLLENAAFEPEKGAPEPCPSLQKNGFLPALPPTNNFGIPVLSVVPSIGLVSTLSNSKTCCPAWCR